MVVKSSSSPLSRRGYEDFDVRKQGCALGFAQSAMVGKKLYVDGGLMWYNNGTSHEGPNMWLRVLDTSKSFPVYDDVQEIPIQFLERPAEVPEISGGDLWAYNDALYLRPGYIERADEQWPGFNGFPNGTVVDFWRYDIQSSSWDLFQHNPKTTAGEIVPRVKHPVTVSIDSLKKAYVISGEDDGNNGFANGMLVYDFEKESWTHHSTPWSNWASGLAVHVPDPVDGPGYILAFAGRSAADNRLNRIEIYDLASEVWRTTQFAAPAEERIGVPQERQKPCAVMARAKDGSSYNIYVYGGIDLGGSSGYADVWVLSIPSFRWILVHTGAGNAPQGLESMACNIVGGGRKMIVYGGRHAPGNRGGECEPGGTHVFDLTTLEWEPTYDSAGDEYQVPSVIYNIIGGDAFGGATLLPKVGFANSDMEKKFEAMISELKISQNDTDTGSSTSVTPPPTSATNSVDESEEGGATLSAGAIAGIVIGAIFGLTLIALLLLWFRRSRKNASEKFPRTPAEMGGESPTSGLQPQITSPPQELYSHVPSEMPAISQPDYAQSNMSYYEPKTTESPRYQVPTSDRSQLQDQYQAPNQPQDQYQSHDRYQPLNQPQDQYQSHDQYQAPNHPQDQYQLPNQYPLQDQTQFQHQDELTSNVQGNNQRYYGS